MTLLRVIVSDRCSPRLSGCRSACWIGLSPRLAEKVQPLAQFLAAFPANVIFPIAVVLIVRFSLNPDIWLSPLIIFGTQWYILFNVDRRRLRLSQRSARSRGKFRIPRLGLVDEGHPAGDLSLLRHRRLDGLGRIVERRDRRRIRQMGQRHGAAHGIGAYIAKATEAGDFPKIVLGVAVMSIFVILFNRLFWRPLFALAERRLQLD